MADPNCSSINDPACKFDPPDVPATNVVDKWDLWHPDSEGRPRLRGANIFQRTVASDSSPQWCSKLHEKFFVQLREAGANYVNLSIPGTYNVNPSIPVDSTKPRYAEIKSFADRLDTLICWAKKAQLWVVISFRSAPGRSESDIVPEAGAEVVRQLFVSEEAQAAFAEMWETIALRYKNHPNVAGYDLLVEPHKRNEVQGEKFDFDQFRERWRNIATNTIERIRSVDTKTPILVNLDEYSGAEAIVNWQPLFADDTKNVRRIVTAVHQYVPYAYTHNDASSGDTSFDPSAKELHEAFGWINNWRLKNPNLPVAANEYGLKPSRPESFRFLKEEIKQLETLGLNHAIWLWDLRDEDLGDCYDDQMDVFFDPKSKLSDFSRVLRDAWNHGNPILPPK